MSAYEVRISDWSSDVCSSDLQRPDRATPTSDPHPRRRRPPPLRRPWLRLVLSSALLVHRVRADGASPKCWPEAKQSSGGGRIRGGGGPIGRASCRESVSQYV